MKTFILPTLLLLAAISPILAEEPPGVPAAKEPAPNPGPTLVQSYKDVLAVIPQEFSPDQASKWTEVKKKVINDLLKENVGDLHTPARFRAKVSQVAYWPGLTLFWEVPNQEGYHIRLFAGFSDDWKARLSMLNIGDDVIVEGTFNTAIFMNVWGDDTLSLCLSGCSFSRMTQDKQDTSGAGESGEPRIVSASYGTAAHSEDVTQRVHDLLHQGSQSFSANPQSLGLDPAYGAIKTLVITFEQNERRHTFTTTESGQVDMAALMDAAKRK